MRWLLGLRKHSIMNYFELKEQAEFEMTLIVSMTIAAYVGWWLGQRY